MESATRLAGPRPNPTSGYGRLDVRAALRATPAPDLSEPNDWVSAARSIAPLAHAATASATVGGANDPLDAYPFVTKGRSVVTLASARTLQGFVLRAGSLGAIERSAAALKAGAATAASGTTVHLRVPGKGRWYLVVTAPRAVAPVGYTLHLP
jgi:hypothetical protein